MTMHSFFIYLCVGLIGGAVGLQWWQTPIMLIVIWFADAIDAYLER
jgi:hypothetical protein